MSSETAKAGYKNTEVGMIPEDWDVKSIGNQIDLLTGFPFPSNQYSQTGTRLLRGSNIKRGETDWSEEITEYWSQDCPKLKRYLLCEGDLVISLDGSLVGKSHAKLSKSDIPALLLQRVARIRSQKIDIEYLKQFVGSKVFTKYCDSVKTVTAIPHISPDDIRNFTIPFPPTLEEQTTIAAALSDADALIASLDRLIAKKRNIKQAAMQELLTGKKRLPGFGVVKGYQNTDLGEIPEDWKIKPIGSQIDLLTGHPFPSIQYAQNGIRLLRGSNIKRGMIDWSEEITEYWSQVTPELKRYLLCDGDLVIPMDGSLVGRSYAKISKKDLPSLLLQRVARIRSDKIDIGYLKEFINSDLFVKYSDSVKTVTAIPHISPDDIKEFSIPFPPTLQEQTAIATVLSDMDAEISGLEEKRDKARMIKEGMMQELLTGRIRLV